MLNRRMCMWNRPRFTLQRPRWWWLRRCSSLASMTARITGRIAIARIITIMIIIIIIMTGTITVITVAAIGIIIGDKLM